MKTGPNSRRYIVPAAWLVTALAAYGLGYATNSIFSTPTAAEMAASAGANGGHGTGPGASTDPAAMANANRVGGSFADAGGATGGMTVGQITGGQPLEEWLKKLMAQDDETFRMTQFMKLFETLNTPEDVMAALKVLGETNRAGNQNGGGGFGRGGRFLEASMLLQKLTKLDPKAALAFAGEAKGGEKMMATATVTRTWAKTDPDAALAWAKENGVPKEGEEGAGGGRGRGGPGGNENWALQGVITQIAKTNIDKALTEASAIEGRMGGRTADALVGEMIQQKGMDAARKAIDSLPEGDFKNSYIQDFATKYAEQDPKAASVWAMGMAAGDPKSRALRQTVDEWIKKDAASAGTFVGSLPVAADSDSARSLYAVNVAAKDQATALATLGKITNPERQTRAVGEIAMSLARTDIAASKQFVAQSPIDEQSKARLAEGFNVAERFGERFNRGGGGATGAGATGAGATGGVAPAGTAPATGGGGRGRGGRGAGGGGR